MQLPFNFCSLLNFHSIYFESFRQSAMREKWVTTKCLFLCMICRFCNYCHLSESTCFFLNTKVEKQQIKGRLQREGRNIFLLLWMGKIKMLQTSSVVHTFFLLCTHRERVDQSRHTPFFSLTCLLPWLEVAQIRNQ